MSPVDAVTVETPDPSLELLVPPTRAWHLPALVVGGVVLLLAAWLSHGLLRPELSTGSAAASVSRVTTADGVPLVVAVASNEPSSWASFDVVAVNGVPGASVAGSWLLQGDGLEGPDAPESPESLADYLAVAVPTLGDDDRLPVRVPGDAARVTLVVAWQIEDCDALESWMGSEPGMLLDPAAPTVRLRTVVGTTYTTQVPFAGPVFGGIDGVAEFRDVGFCP